MLINSKKKEIYRYKIFETLQDYILYSFIIFLYCLPYLFRRDLFFRDESRYGGIVLDMVRNDYWFTLKIGGDYYLDKPPLFFTLLRAATEVIGTSAPWVFFAVVAVTALLFLIASDTYLRAATIDRPTRRITNLLILAVPWIAIHMQILRMDLLFSALILFSVASYIHGIERQAANIWPLIGGLLAGLGVLVKGPFGAIIPVATVISFLLAKSRIQLLLRPDQLWSIAIMALPIVAWLANIYVAVGDLIFDEIFGDQIIQRAFQGRDSHRPWWLYPAVLILTAMPWLLLAPALFARRLRHTLLMTFLSTPASASTGWKLISASLISTLLILSLVAQRHIHYLLPVVPMLMVVIAVFYRTLDNVAPRLIDWFYVGVAFIVLIAPPAGLWILYSGPERIHASLMNYVRPETLSHAAAAITLTAIPLAIAARLRGEARLLAGVIAVAIMTLVIKLVLLPDLDRIFSPRHTATLFEARIPEGEKILVYEVYWGSLSYHFDRPLIYIDRPATVTEILNKPEGPNYAIVPNSAWSKSSNLWNNFEKIEETRLERTRLLLLRRIGSM